MSKDKLKATKKGTYKNKLIHLFFYKSVEKNLFSLRANYSLHYYFMFIIKILKSTLKYRQLSLLSCDSCIRRCCFSFKTQNKSQIPMIKQFACYLK